MRSTTSTRTGSPLSFLEGPPASMPAWLTLIQRGSDDTDWKKQGTPEEEMDHP
jgi:hypothetical protein